MKRRHRFAVLAILFFALAPDPGLTNTTEYLELVSGLEGSYGKSYLNPMQDGLRSWFEGGTEVQLIATPNYGYCLSYIDLHQVQDAGM